MNMKMVYYVRLLYKDYKTTADLFEAVAKSVINRITCKYYFVNGEFVKNPRPVTYEISENVSTEFYYNKYELYLLMHSDHMRQYLEMKKEITNTPDEVKCEKRAIFEEARKHIIAAVQRIVNEYKIECKMIEESNDELYNFVFIGNDDASEPASKISFNKSSKTAIQINISDLNEDSFTNAKIMQNINFFDIIVDFGGTLNYESDKTNATSRNHIKYLYVLRNCDVRFLTLPYSAKSYGGLLVDFHIGQINKSTKNMEKICRFLVSKDPLKSFTMYKSNIIFDEKQIELCRSKQITVTDAQLQKSNFIECVNADPFDVLREMSAINSTFSAFSKVAKKCFFTGLPIKDGYHALGVFAREQVKLSASKDENHTTESKAGAFDSALISKSTFPLFNFELSVSNTNSTNVKIEFDPPIFIYVSNEFADTYVNTAGLTAKPDSYVQNKLTPAMPIIDFIEFVTGCKFVHYCVPDSKPVDFTDMSLQIYADRENVDKRVYKYISNAVETQNCKSIHHVGDGEYVTHWNVIRSTDFTDYASVKYLENAKKLYVFTNTS